MGPPFSGLAGATIVQDTGTGKLISSEIPFELFIDRKYLILYLHLLPSSRSISQPVKQRFLQSSHPTKMKTRFEGQKQKGAAAKYVQSCPLHLQRKRAPSEHLYVESRVAATLSKINSIEIIRFLWLTYRRAQYNFRVHPFCNADWRNNPEQ